MQIQNDLDMPLTIYTTSQGRMTALGVADPGENFNLPLSYVYESENGLFFQVQG